VLAVYETVKRAVVRAAQPRTCADQCRSLPLYGHSKSDKQRYRTKEEVEAWRARDPIITFRDRLIAAGILTETIAADLADQAQQTINDAIAWGDTQPEPSVAHLTTMCTTMNRSAGCAGAGPAQVDQTHLRPGHSHQSGTRHARVELLRGAAGGHAPGAAGG